MKNIITNLLMRGATALMLIGLGIVITTTWGLFSDSKINKEAVEIDVKSVKNFDMKDKVFVNIKGGVKDLSNVIHYTLEASKHKLKLNTKYFIPVLSDDGKVAYILDMGELPSGKNNDEIVDYSGKIMSQRVLPNDVLKKFKQIFQREEFIVLDEGYKPKTALEKLQSAVSLIIGLGFLFIVIGYIGRKVVQRFLV